MDLSSIWFLKLELLKTTLSTGFRSWDTQCGAQTPGSSGRSSGFWVPSRLWVAVPRLGFMMRLSSFYYMLLCGPLSLAWFAGVPFFRGSCSIFSCRFNVSMEEVGLGFSYLTILTLGEKKWSGKTCHPLFFRVHVCPPKQCVSPPADASCDFNGTTGCHFWRNWHVGKK